MAHDHPNDSGSRDSGWFDQPRNVTLIIRALVVVCVLLIGAEFLYEKHPHFAYEGWFGINAMAGFLAYVAIVTLARGLRVLVKRDERYYAEDEVDNDEPGDGADDGGSRAH